MSHRLGEACMCALGISLNMLCFLRTTSSIQWSARCTPCSFMTVACPACSWAEDVRVCQVYFPSIPDVFASTQSMVLLRNYLSAKAFCACYNLTHCTFLLQTREFCMHTATFASVYIYIYHQFILWAASAQQYLMCDICSVAEDERTLCILYNVCTCLFIRRPLYVSYSLSL